MRGKIPATMRYIRRNPSLGVGIGLLLDRSGAKAKFDYPLKTLATTEVTNYRPEECPQCKKGEPLIKPGSRKMD